jgi:hypothetical protein
LYIFSKKISRFKKINEGSNEDDEVEAELKKLGIFNTILNILYKRKF